MSKNKNRPGVGAPRQSAEKEMPGKTKPNSNDSLTPNDVKYNSFIAEHHPRKQDSFLSCFKMLGGFEEEAA